MNDKFLSIITVLGLVLLAGALAYGNPRSTITTNEEAVIPTAGIELPIVVGDLWEKLVATGVIDETKFSKQPIETSKKLRITRENSRYILNLFWAFGLANKNEILETGEMTDKRYGGAGNFASTGGWTLAKGNAMEHYSKHVFVALSVEQQALVDRVSQNIYRPCCGNSTHFPDCNHGMAMLGLLELMAAQGVGEQDMYRVALVVNSYWFPETYLTIATYMQQKKIAWKDVDPKEMLSSNYSSSSGYQQISAQVVKPPEKQGGSSCST